MKDNLYRIYLKDGSVYNLNAITPDDCLDKFVFKGTYEKVQMALSANTCVECQGKRKAKTYYIVNPLNILEAMKQIDINIGKKYFKCSDNSGLTESNAYMWLKSDVENIYYNFGKEKFDEVIYSIKCTYYGKEIFSRFINLEDIEKVVSIRVDFEKALNSVQRGEQLSGILSYSFSDKDIKNLALLHKANKCRRKIEDLLDDCNFHQEAGDFKEGKYDEYLKLKDK